MMLKTSKETQGKGLRAKNAKIKPPQKERKQKIRIRIQSFRVQKRIVNKRKMNEMTEKKQRSPTFIIIIPRRGKPSPKMTSKLGHGARDPSRASDHRSGRDRQRTRAPDSRDSDLVSPGGSSRCLGDWRRRPRGCRRRPRGC